MAGINQMGRQVDVRVLSCEQRGESENKLYYEMKVDFYDTNGEVLVRTMMSGKPYMPGTMIRCRYLEQKGLLLEEMTPEVQKKSKNNLLLFFIIFLIFVGIVAAAIWGMMTGKELSNGTERLIGYFISILFMAVGISGIYKKIEKKQRVQDMILLPGVQVDYTVSESLDHWEDGSVRTTEVYNPIYEYVWEGERRRIQGSVGASGKKYKAIGRNVHILLNPYTGKAVCQEDEKSMENWFLIFGVIGLILFILLMALSLGILS